MLVLILKLLHIAFHQYSMTRQHQKRGLSEPRPSGWRLAILNLDSAVR